MKKFLLVMLAVLMMTVSAVCAQETETIPEVNWADIEAAVAESGISGRFVSVSDLGLMMWAPDSLVEVELSDEDFEAGYLCVLMTEDGEAGVAVVYEDIEGASLEDMQAMFSDLESVSEVEMGIINGVNVLTFNDTETDAMCFVYTTDAGYAVEFYFSPMSNEDFAPVVTFMAASIQPVSE